MLQPSVPAATTPLSLNAATIVSAIAAPIAPTLEASTKAALWLRLPSITAPVVVNMVVVGRVIVRLVPKSRNVTTLEVRVSWLTGQI